MKRKITIKRSRGLWDGDLRSSGESVERALLPVAAWGSARPLDAVFGPVGVERMSWLSPLWCLMGWDVWDLRPRLLHVAAFATVLFGGRRVVLRFAAGAYNGQECPFYGGVFFFIDQLCWSIHGAFGRLLG